MDAAPVIARGHSLAILVPPSAAAAAPFLLAIPEHRPTLVLTADADRAVLLAEALPRAASLAVSTPARGARHLARGVPDTLYVSAPDALQLLTQSRLDCAAFRTVVIAWPEQLDDEGREALVAVLGETDRDSQRMIFTATPGAALEDLLQRYAFKAVTFGFPPAEAAPAAKLGPASYVLARPSQFETTRRRILDALDPEQDDDVAIAPCPSSRDEAEALAGAAPGGGRRRLVFVVDPAQVDWLRTLFAPLTPLPLPGALRGLQHRADLVRARLARTLEAGNLDRELFLIGPLLERYDPAEVAAAALRLAGEGSGAPAEAAGPPAADEPMVGGLRAGGAGVPTWAKVWVGVGRKDNVRPGDVLGAIVGETGLAADRVGKIDVRELFCLLEVQADAAEQVIHALNGTTLRGRRLVARFDRGHGPSRPGARRGPPGPPPGAPDHR